MPARIVIACMSVTLFSTEAQYFGVVASGGLEGGEGGRTGTRQKIVTQPCEEVCDLGGAGSGACETRREGATRRFGRGCGGATFPIGT